MAEARTSLPPQYRQTWADQLQAVALQRRSPTPTQTSIASIPYNHSPIPPPLSTPSLHPLRGDVQLQPPPLAAAYQETPQSLPSPVQPAHHATPLATTNAVTTYIGDILSPTPSSPASKSAAVAAHEEPYEPGLWRQQVDEAIRALETETLRGDHDREEKARLEAYRRLLHVVSNHRELAVSPIEQLDEDEQAFWKHQLYGLLIALDADGKHASSRRSALALRDLREAAHHLANISTLDLRNLTFCSEVVSFGVNTEFDSFAFRPGDEVVLYIEVDNFAAHPKGDQYETELHGSYEILDDAGRRVTNNVLPLDRQVCNNRRRDYFIPYVLTMPDDIEPGTYRLQLTIEDVIGKKSNQASIDFRIR
jgi:hypothetical protein